VSPERIRPGSARGRSAGTDVPADAKAVDSPTDGVAEQRVEHDAEDVAIDGIATDGIATDGIAIVEPEGGTASEELVGLEEPFEAEQASNAGPAGGAWQPSALDETREAFVNKGSRAAPEHKHGFFRRLYFGETNLEFVGRRKLWFAISAVVILAGVISLSIRGLNLDIEFVGGTSWTVQSPTLTVNQVRTSLNADNLTGETITILGNGSKDRSVQIEAKIPKGQTANQTQSQLVKVESSLQSLAHVSRNGVSIESVGPSWGSTVTNKAIEALVVFFVLVALYISIFFEWRMALAAIIAVIHDILVVVGIYSLTGFDVTPDTVVAILTILGYSLYDTIVVFDRVRDNLKGVGSGGRLTISDIVNLSMNQTLARSINTSFVAILPIFSVLILGAEVLGATTLQYFGWALLIGLTSGAYSSIFIASPIVAVLKEHEPRWRRIREKLDQRGADRLVLSPAQLAAGLFGSEGASPAANRARSRAASKRSTARGGSGGPGGSVATVAIEDGRPASGPSTSSTGTGSGVDAPTKSAGTARKTAASSSQRRPSGGPKRKGGRR